MRGDVPDDPRRAPVERRGTEDGDRIHLDRLRFALDTGQLGVWNWEADTEEFFGDQGLSLLWGLREDQTLSTSLFRAALEPDDADRATAELRRAAAPDGPERCQLEVRIRRSDDGAERWIALQGRRFAADPSSDSPAELVGMARDITDRKQRETHLHMLMREVTHRSKNLLAIIQAMARQTVKDSLTASEFESRFSARLRGLAVSHDLLAARDWHGAGMDDLVRWQLGPALEEAGGRVSITGPDVYLTPEAAQNIGLALNELASNAARFGALSNASGRIEVAWTVDPVDAEPRRFHVGWSETGGPEVTAPRRHGFGHKVVERLAARALDGDVTLSFAASGLRWALDIPASFLVDAEDVPRVN